MSEERKPTNGNGVWRWIAMAVCGVLLGMFVKTLAEPKDTVSEKELTLQVVQLQSKIDSLTNEVVALRASVNQQNVDIAGIASKVGVTAHPVVAPVH